ncbi:MAG: hypothetical protein HY042_09115 [Spirochaetia bacterium]|nr:hypothetical protein [Spirochaetia bacterium]
MKRRMNALRMLKEKHWQRYVESEKGKIRNLVVEKPRRLEVEGFNASTLPVSGQESALVGTEISGITDNFLRVMVNVETLVEKGNVIPVEVGPVVEPGIVRGFVRGAVARDTDFSAATR